MSAPVPLSSRGLSPVFMADLQEGLLQPVLALVHADDTLTLCIRNEYVNIYYRGGSLLRISPAPGGGYSFGFDQHYENDRPTALDGHVPTANWKLLHHAQRVDCSAAVALWLCQIPLLKQTMDFWFSANPKPEREFQQLMERTNNCNWHTDYYIVDIEYTNRSFRELRADMLALWWPRTKEARREGGGFLPRLTIIEVKWADSALKGTAGMVDHVQKMTAAHGNGNLDFAVVAKETLAVFRQRVELGLIRCDGKETQFSRISQLQQQIDYLFLVTDHDPDSTVLVTELSRVEAMSNLPFSVKVAFGSPMGFGLFDQKIKDLSIGISLLQ